MSNEYPAAGSTRLPAALPRPHADLVLGIFLLSIGTLAALFTGGPPIGPLAQINPWFFPACVTALLLLTGVLLAGLSLTRRPVPAPWQPTELVVIAALAVAGYLVAVDLTPGGWAVKLALKFGPADYVATIVLMLTILVVMAHSSRVRAFGIALLGILLALIGTDVNSGLQRYTFGIAQLADGIEPVIVMLGLLVVADGLLCLMSPGLFINSYTRLMPVTFFQRISGTASVPAGLLLRVLAFCSIGTVCNWINNLNNEIWDVGIVLAFGAFGVACKLFGWNRYILCAAFTASPLLEENLRRALLLAKGDPAVFLQRPISAALLASVCLLLLARPVREMVAGRARTL